MNEFTQGDKHPDTHRVIFKNVREWDRLRRILKARCDICDAVVSRDPQAVRELVYRCKNKWCHCQKLYGSQAHQVCNLCYDVFHALYVNHGLRDMNYFRDVDENDDNDDNRKRMGLSG